jgi:hypothetical protein
VSKDSGPKLPKTFRDMTRTELNQQLALETANLGRISVNDLLDELRSRDARDAARRTFWTAVFSSVAAFFSAIAAVVTVYLSLTHQQPSSVPPPASSVAPASPASPRSR